MSEKMVEKVRELIDNQNKLVNKVKELETDMLQEREEAKIQTRIDDAVKNAVDKIEGKVTPPAEPAPPAKKEEKPAKKEEKKE